ncbi:MAG TPA: sulfoxide reductase heme-binding subunit YedZ [Thiolapillus brandeum]|uniref:Protein-methionine-sulfoxide reductase heme-binding subunit MsrQ n=1 Tax=Thiolapillus brandeum TaxID=1076588 RepID=A0A831KCK4_9GAMM|nr:sulfoxide reductase heme-binding subunit YedZ [Thiolapillus brandeum]
MIKWRIMVFALSLLPLAAITWGMFNDGLGPNPVEALSHETGSWALRFLLITLAMTPLRRLTGWRRPVLLRRMLGLFSFFYVCLHVLVWLWLDREFAWSGMLADIAKRPYITVGFLSFMMLTALALTSNTYSMRRLGKRWQALHRLVYAAAALAVLHFIWLVKADLLQPLIYLGILVVLMLLRMPRIHWIDKPRRITKAKKQAAA